LGRQVIGFHQQAGMCIQAIDECLDGGAIAARQGVHADFDGCAH
jgi:methionyl-tRNA formyltransferase